MNDMMRDYGYSSSTVSGHLKTLAELGWVKIAVKRRSRGTGGRPAQHVELQAMGKVFEHLQLATPRQQHGAGNQKAKKVRLRKIAFQTPFTKHELRSEIELQEAECSQEKQRKAVIHKHVEKVLDEKLQELGTTKIHASRSKIKKLRRIIRHQFKIEEEEQKQVHLLRNFIQPDVNYVVTTSTKHMARLLGYRSHTTGSKGLRKLAREGKITIQCDHVFIKSNANYKELEYRDLPKNYIITKGGNMIYLRPNRVTFGPIAPDTVHSPTKDKAAGVPEMIFTKCYLFDHAKPFVFRCGRYKGKHISEIEEATLRGYLQYLLKKTDNPFTVENITPVLDSLNN